MTIATTTANVPTAAEADAFYAGVQARAAEKRAAKAAKAERQAAATKRREEKAAAQLAAAMAQYDRDVAANPNTIIYNPTTKNYDAYRHGEIVAQAGSYLEAEAARLALVTRDMDAPAADLVVTEIVETTAGDVAVSEVVLAEAVTTDPRCGTCYGEGWIDPEGGTLQGCPDCHGTGMAATTEEATMEPETYAREVIEVEQAGMGEFAAPSAADRLRAAGWVQSDEIDGYPWQHPAMSRNIWRTEADALRVLEFYAADPHQPPAPLPTCARCGRTILHGETWCGCLLEVAPVSIADKLDADAAYFPLLDAPPPAPSASEPAAPIDWWDEQERFGAPLPFTPTPDERTAALIELETEAGVTAVAPPESRLAEWIAGCHLLLVAWGDVLVDGQEPEPARYALIRALLDVEQRCRLVAVSAVPERLAA